MFYIKTLKKNEHLKLQAVKQTPELSQASLPFFLLKHFAVMPLATRIDIQERPEIGMLIPKLNKMYTLKTKSFSEGIYSFARHGRNKRNGEPYYRYLQKEINTLVSETTVELSLKETFNISWKMWKKGIENANEVNFESYEILHGDLHSGNILKFRQNIYLIDWEYLRSGPKEVEISFYLLWHYLQYADYASNFDILKQELDEFVRRKTIKSDEAFRILNILIPMWFIVDICYLTSNKLSNKKNRIEACQKMVLIYEKEIFES